MAARTLLFYTHAHGGGGAEITFDRLARAFAAKGDRVIFAVDRGAADDDRDANPRRLAFGAGHLRATLRLAVLLARERPDAAFSALGAQNLKHLAAAALTGRMSRCVLGVHGFPAAEPGRLSQLFFRLVPLATRLAAATVCVSDVLLADMARRGGVGLRRVYNPVPDASTPSTVAKVGYPPLILALGRFERVKRFPDLVAAVARCATPGVRLAILGDGPERAAVEDAAVRCGLAGRVDLPGFVADPVLWYARASCVAVASETESFGLTAVEALAWGLPVVTTECGGTPEVLGGYGRIVPIGDVEALAAALDAVLAAPGDPASRRARARLFSVDRAVAAYAAIADALR